MFIDERYGPMFELGEWIFYPGRIKYPKQGIVIEAHYPEGGEVGWYKIIMDDGSKNSRPAWSIREDCLSSSNTNDMTMAAKNDVIKHIEKLFENMTHVPDAAGRYHDYPLQSLFTIVHGAKANGYVDLSVSAKMILTKKNFKIDKAYPSMKLTWLGTNTKWQYAVQINEPKDFKKTTGGDFKQIIIGYEKSPNNHVYKNEHMFHFNAFEDANEFYAKMADRLSLTEDTYRNERYVQLYNDRAPEFTREAYLDLIQNFNIF